MNRYSAFYLHGGPAGSSALERQKLGGRTAIYWWDQPRPYAATSGVFDQLVAETKSEFLRHANGRGGRLTLLANSFGAQLALRLADQIPLHIESITLLAPTANLPQAFLRLARRIATVSTRPLPIQTAADAFEARSDDRDCFWRLVDVVVSTPNFVDLYWGPSAGEPRQWFEKHATDPAVFDFVAFRAIVDDFLDTPAFQGRSRFTGPVSIVLGVYDPFIDPETGGLPWIEHFPQATMRVVEAGHFPHLELPIFDWWLP